MRLCIVFILYKRMFKLIYPGFSMLPTFAFRNWLFTYTLGLEIYNIDNTTPCKQNPKGPMILSLCNCLLISIIVPAGSLIASQVMFKAKFLPVPPRWALSDATLEKLRNANEEFVRLKNILGNNNAESDTKTEQYLRWKELNTILKCQNSLREIDSDLLLFEAQLKSQDETVRNSAQSFKQQFLSCKSNIELHLTKLLA
jgi:hypothetical protein